MLPYIYDGKLYNPVPPPLVFDSNLEPLRNKHGGCLRCGTLPPEGEKFRKCTGCKTALYCTKWCQKDNWPMHRVSCKYIQGLSDQKPYVFSPRKPHPLGQADMDQEGVRHEAMSWPADVSEKERYVLLNDFLTIHRTNFAQAVASLRNVLHRQYATNRDLDDHALVFKLGYRTNHDGNPATRLFIRKIEVTEIPQEVKENTARQFGFPRVAVLLWHAGGMQVCEPLLLEDITPSEKSQLDHFWTDWITHLRFVTTVGVAGPANSISIGLMRQNKSKWEWTEISSGELEPLRKKRWRHMGPEPELRMEMLYDSLKRRK